MAKKLNLLPDEEFLLFGILSQEKDYRLCFEINRKLETAFEKDLDLELFSVKQNIHSLHSRYSYEDPEGRLLYILSNKGTNALMVPEQKPVDYFFLLKGVFFNEDKSEFLTGLRQVPGIQGAYELEPDKLKSKQNFVF